MITNLEQLYFDQIRDLYSAETQLLAALPEMAANATHGELREAFNHHLQETRGQRERLRKSAPPTASTRMARTAPPCAVW